MATLLLTGATGFLGSYISRGWTATLGSRLGIDPSDPGPQCRKVQTLRLQSARLELRRGDLMDGRACATPRWAPTP